MAKHSFLTLQKYLLHFRLFTRSPQFSRTKQKTFIITTLIEVENIFRQQGINFVVLVGIFFVVMAFVFEIYVTICFRAPICIICMYICMSCLCIFYSLWHPNYSYFPVLFFNYIFSFSVTIFFFCLK